MSMTLGLDVGTNSLGWALIDEGEDGAAGAIRAAGVRVFQEAVEPKSGNQRTPKNHKRRQSRLMRRQIRRRRQRRRALFALLRDHGLLPDDVSAQLDLLTDDDRHNPYRLRALGVHERLEPWEFGRVLYHLNHRRGFKSNRHTRLGTLAAEPEVGPLILADEQRDLARARARQRKAPAGGPSPADEDESELLVEIGALWQTLRNKGWTLGEYLYQAPVRRGLHTDRAMYEEEFERLWRTQQIFHPDLLTEDLHAAVHAVLFTQRPLVKPEAGRCALEPTRRRAPKALLEFQRFRLLQAVNHLEVLEAGALPRPLGGEERDRLLDALADRQREGATTLTWAAVRKLLKLSARAHFNLETSLPNGLPTNRTAMQVQEAAPVWWASTGEEAHRALVTDLLTIGDRRALYRRLRGPAWGFSLDEAYRLATVELEVGYAQWSRKVLVKTLPGLERGLNLHDALQAAGYQRPDQRPATQADALPLPPDLHNPTVNRALTQVRRVVNAILRTYGRPDTIRVELARDVKLSKKDRDRVQKQQRANARVNAQAREQFLALMGREPRASDVLKYRLWQEAGQMCLYTGRPIALTQLWSPNVETEHIVPYSRSLDDSYMNKTVSLAAFNARKGQRTPHETFEADPDQYAEFRARLQHAKNVPPAKVKRFLMTDVPEDFVNRQLSDTRFIAKETVAYLGVLGIPVDVTRGGATAALRHSWGLNHILNPVGGIKTREDHRHHAVDAMVVALTSRRVFHRLALSSRATGRAPGEPGFQIDPPWPTLFEDARQAVAAIVVSHEVRHKIAGAFHNETAYGPRQAPGEFAYRRPLSAFVKPSAVAAIIDPVVRSLVEQRLMTHQGPGSAFGPQSAPLLHKDGRTVIKTVRVRKIMKPGTYYTQRDPDGRPLKVYAYDSNHHVEILERDAKRVGVFVTTMEAARRAVHHEAVVQRVGPWVSATQTYDTSWTFVMALHVNDTVRLDTGLYRVQKLDASNNRLILRHVNDTRSEHDGAVSKTPDALRDPAVTVDVLGRVVGS